MEIPRYQEEKTQEQIARELILDAVAAEPGVTLWTQVMIGDQPLPGISDKTAQAIVFDMLDKGEITLNTDYSLRIAKSTWD